MATEITVRGSYSAFQPPERGTVHASIAYEGPAMEPVYDRVARDLESVKASIIPMESEDQGAVTWWSAEQLRTWSNRPWNKDGKQLPLVHHASVAVEVKFRDFAALSRWVGEHTANTEGFRVSSVEWAPTDIGERSCSQEVRTRAVPDAVRARSSTPMRWGWRHPARRHRRRGNAWRAPQSGWGYGSSTLRPRGRWRRAMSSWSRRHRGCVAVDARFVVGDA